MTRPPPRADAMKTEYDAIYRAGLLLQIDCPDLAMNRHIQFAMVCDAAVDVVWAKKFQKIWPAMK